ncbi:MAG: hypothetical protein EHM48_04285, partial [Planctomycetaceae bacterium]
MVRRCHAPALLREHVGRGRLGVHMFPPPGFAKGYAGQDSNDGGSTAPDMAPGNNPHFFDPIRIDRGYTYRKTAACLRAYQRITMSITEVLLEKGLIKPDHLAQAMELRKTGGMRLDRALISLGHVTEEQVLAVMSEQLAIPIVNLENISIAVETLRLLPAKLVYRKRVVPVERNNGTLKVATADPFDLYTFDELRLLTGLEIQPLLASQEEIDKVIKAHYGVGGDTIDEMMSTDDLEVVSETSGDNEDLLEMAQEASVIKLVNEIFLEALNERASDIHIEPYEKDLSIRYRIDGVLQNATVPPQIRRFQAAIISRIKILSNMNIAEKRLPQDGRINFQVGNRQVDVRVSVIPMLFGEGIVMRILDKSQVLYT